MVLIWLRNWFPVESAFCLPERGHWLMSEVQWEMTALTALICLFHRQTDTHHEFLFLLSSLATTHVFFFFFFHRASGDHNSQCKGWWWEGFEKKANEYYCSFKLQKSWRKHLVEEFPVNIPPNVQTLQLICWHAAVCTFLQLMGLWGLNSGCCLAGLMGREGKEDVD